MKNYFEMINFAGTWIFADMSEQAQEFRKTHDAYDVINHSCFSKEQRNNEFILDVIQYIDWIMLVDVCEKMYFVWYEE